VTDLLVEEARPRPTVLVRLLNGGLSIPEAVLRLMRAGTTSLMLESPQFFIAFRHTLDTLQVRLS
jgi:hypothetical protein